MCALQRVHYATLYIINIVDCLLNPLANGIFILKISDQFFNFFPFLLQEFFNYSCDFTLSIKLAQNCLLNCIESMSVVSHRLEASVIGRVNRYE